MLGLAGVPSFIQLIGMFGMPESQRWLAKLRQYEEMREVLNYIYISNEIENQVKTLETEMESMRE